MTAPTDSAGLAEIVVTAERREQRLQDVPAAVTAIGGAELASRVVLSIPDALSSVPDLQISKAYGEGGAPNFVIRGISSTDFAMASSKPVALYFDEGVRTMSVFENMPIFDIDRIEVLRGPQGTLYGRNATAGAVNILSKTPGFDTEGYITAGYGNFNESTLQGAFQTAIIDNVLSARVAFTYNRNKGVIKQLTPGLGNLDQTDVFAVRGTLFFQPSPEFDATLRLVHYTTGGRDAASYPGPVGPHFNLDGYPGLQAVPGALRQGAGFFDSATDVAPSRSIGVDGINLLVHWHISDAYTLTSVTTYDVGRWRSDQDVDGLPLSMDFTDTQVRGAGQFVQDIRLVSRLSGPFDWQAGVMHTQDVAHPAAHFLYSADPRCGAPCDFGFGDGGYGIAQNNGFTQRRSDDSGYVKGEYKILPTLKFSAGVRQSFDHLSATDYAASIGDSVNHSSVVSFVDQSDHANFRNTSKEAGLDWHVSDNLLAYISYKEAYRTGAVNSGAFYSTAEITIAPPELVKSYEGGLKSTLWDRKLTANLTVFDEDYRNQQISESVVVTGGVITPLLSLPKARVRGAELEASVRPIPEVQLSANVSFLDPKYTQATFSGVSLVGNQMVNAARRSGSLSGDFTLLSKDVDKVTWNINGTYTSKLFYDVLNTADISQPAWWVWNSRLDYTHDNTSVDAYVKNLANKEYIISAFEDPPIPFAMRGYPRQFGVQVTQRF